MIPFVVAMLMKNQPVPIPTSVGSYVLSSNFVITWVQGGVGCSSVVYRMTPVGEGGSGEYEAIDTLGLDVMTSNPGLPKDGSTVYNIGVRHFRGTRSSEMVTITVGP